MLCRWQWPDRCLTTATPRISSFALACARHWPLVLDQILRFCPLNWRAYCWMPHCRWKPLQFSTNLSSHACEQPVHNDERVNKQIQWPCSWIKLSKPELCQITARHIVQFSIVIGERWVIVIVFPYIVPEICRHCAVLCLRHNLTAHDFARMHFLRVVFFVSFCLGQRSSFFPFRLVGLFFVGITYRISFAEEKLCWWSPVKHHPENASNVCSNFLIDRPCMEREREN